jgi:hypothetical protein
VARWIALQGLGAAPLDLWEGQLGLVGDLGQVFEFGVGYPADYFVFLDQQLLLFYDLISQGYLVFEVADQQFLLLRLILDLALLIDDLLLLHCNLLLLDEGEQIVLIRLSELTILDLTDQLLPSSHLVPELLETLLLLQEKRLGERLILLDLILNLHGGSILGLLGAGHPILESLPLLILPDHQLEDLKADVLDLLVILKGLLHQIHLFLEVGVDVRFDVRDYRRLVAVAQRWQ